MSRQQSHGADRPVATGPWLALAGRWRALDADWQAVAVALCIVVAVVIGGAIPW